MDDEPKPKPKYYPAGGGQVGVDENPFYVLNPREKYLFGSCARHAETLGVIMGVPAACASYTLFRRRFRTSKKAAVVALVAVPAYLATHLFFATFYSGTICWQSVDLLPEDSKFREMLVRAQEKRAQSGGPVLSRAIPSRQLAILDVFAEEAEIDQNTDLSQIVTLSADEKHCVQSTLRRVPSDQWRLSHRTKEFMHRPVESKWNKLLGWPFIGQDPDHPTVKRVAAKMFHNPVMAHDNVSRAKASKVYVDEKGIPY